MLNQQTSVRTEIIAGITTFVTMAYILFVNPSTLATTGMDPNAVFIATCLGAGIVSIMMGLIVKAPIGLAPGMGLNAYFAVVAAPNGLMTWQTALAAVFISGIIFLILTVTGFRQALVEAVPKSLQYAITVGIGLFIALLGFKLSGLIALQAAPIPPTIESLQGGAPVTLLPFEWNLHLASFEYFYGNSGLLAFIGLLITSILMVRGIKGSILIGIVISTLIGIPMGVTDLSSLQGASWFPDFSNTNFLALDFKGVLGIGILEVIFVFTFVELFDTFGTMVATMDRAGILKQPDGKKRLSKAMMVDASGVSIGALLGTSTITAFVESSSGIEAGGRRGLTAITIGVLFILALFIAPLAGIVPSAATASALIIVGVLMMQNVVNIKFDDMLEAIPAFLTIVLMPLSQSIANGISAGIIFYVILGSLRGKKVHIIMWILAVVVVARYLFIGGEI
ncbi:guanine permease [Ammoniphilus oxalaticus]|uniref:Guanine permease n=1 Tax=Ammoniphilus oxalaticus TaxID=66863 RepID=A0A419SDD7_9BACL|nr:NCS2 family permease [Ammoniphilus oxalaticus]RKD21096.1 guanine permease [Ammoniphilus oxalaticus]